MMSIDETPRTRGEITFIVTVDDDAKTFTVDSTTTGDAALAARKLLPAVQNDALSFIRDRKHSETSAILDPIARRRAAVVAFAVVRGQPQQVELDTTTTGNVHEAAEALVNAAKDELWNWLHDLEHSRV